MGESSEEVDIGRYRASMARLLDIYRGISDTANQVSAWRCPYKNLHDRCTAKFGCRNQDRDDSNDLPVCTGSDKLDYRSAWEV
jgi:hypothetical protein